MTYDGPRRLCSRRGYAQKDSEAAWETRPNTMDATERKRACDTGDAMDTLVESIEVRGKRGRVDAPHLASELAKDVVDGHSR